MKMKVVILCLGIVLAACNRTQFDAGTGSENEGGQSAGTETGNGGNTNGTNSEFSDMMAKSLELSEGKKIFLCFSIPEKPEAGKPPIPPTPPLLCEVTKLAENSISGDCVSGQVSGDRKEVIFSNGEIVKTETIGKIVSPDMNSEQTRKFFSEPPAPPLKMTEAENSVMVYGAKGMAKPSIAEACIPAPLKSK